MRTLLLLCVLTITACEQPFYVPQGGLKCPKGEHQQFDQHRGWICVPDSTSPDSTP